jgi:hypothetical protein
VTAVTRHRLLGASARPLMLDNLQRVDVRLLTWLPGKPHPARGDVTISCGEILFEEETGMNDENKAAALARAGQALGQYGALVSDVLGSLWEESFEQGRLAALDELQDRLCVCMK